MIYSWKVTHSGPTIKTNFLDSSVTVEGLACFVDRYDCTSRVVELAVPVRVVSTAALLVCHTKKGILSNTYICHVYHTVVGVVFTSHLEVDTWSSIL